MKQSKSSALEQDDAKPLEGHKAFWEVIGIFVLAGIAVSGIVYLTAWLCGAV